MANGKVMDINERLVTGFLTRIAAALEGCQNALEEIANTERLAYEMSIDVAAKTNALTGEMAGVFQTMLPGLSSFLGTEDNDDPQT